MVCIDGTNSPDCENQLVSIDMPFQLIKNYAGVNSHFRNNAKVGMSANATGFTWDAPVNILRQGPVPAALCTPLSFVERGYCRLLYFELSNPEIVFVAETGSIEFCGVPCKF